MNRLTTNKPVSEMSMYELAHNNCFAENGEAYYRDFERVISARDLARELMVAYREWDAKDIENTDDEQFDYAMIENLSYDASTNVGLIALLYRNLWTMADLHSRLKEYEDLEEQGLLLRLPCKVGDILWTNNRMQGWYFRLKDAPYRVEVAFIGLNDSEEMGGGFFNVCYENHGYMTQFNFSDIGKTVFFTREEAEEALKKAGRKNE